MNFYLNMFNCMMNRLITRLLSYWPYFKLSVDIWYWRSSLYDNSRVL